MNIAKFDLYKEENEQSASLFDICEWIVYHYPEGIFTGESGDRGAIAVSRMIYSAITILAIRDKKEIKCH